MDHPTQSPDFSGWFPRVAGSQASGDYETPTDPYPPNIQLPPRNWPPNYRCEKRTNPYDLRHGTPSVTWPRLHPVKPNGVTGSTDPIGEKIMRLSRETEYALQGLVFLARQGDGTVVQLADIASAQRIPSTFLSKIFQKLARYGLLRSHRGSLRGYSLGRTANEISLREILEATEGPDLFSRCAFGHHACGGDKNPCVLHGVWRKTAGLLQVELETFSLADLATRWYPTAARPMRHAGPRTETNRMEPGRSERFRPRGRRMTLE